MPSQNRNWLIAFTGCTYDWMLTRQWRSILLGLMPLMFLCIVVTMVLCGHLLSRERLANHYLELANAEVSHWQSQWALNDSADATKQSTAAGANTGSGQSDPSAEDESRTTESDPTKLAAAKEEPLPPFAETLFRRVQQLRSGDQSSVYFVAMSLAQKNLIQQAKSTLRKIAPSDREGFLPAHAWLAGQAFSEKIDSDNFKQLVHHSRMALKWSRTPPLLLEKMAQLFANTGDKKAAIDALKMAADRDARYALPLSKLSVAYGNKMQGEEYSKKAEREFSTRLEANPNDAETRLLLAETLLNQGRIDDGEKLLQEGLSLNESPILKRALSEVYRIRFLQTVKIVDGKWSGDIRMLDQAFRIDPSNPLIAEEVAKLARIGGESPSDELLTQLREFLAEGKATPTTHAWIAEIYLVKNDFEKALPHLEQVVTRLPNAVNYLNNLAFVLVTTRPERLDEALQLVETALKLEPRASDFHDTRGTVLAAMGRHKEAVAAFESAIELEPTRPTFHYRVASSYRKLGEEKQAELHESISRRLIEKQKEEASKPNTAQPEKPEASTKTPAQPDPATKEETKAEAKDSASNSAGQPSKPDSLQK